MGFAIPIDDVKDLITDLMNGNSTTSGLTLGIKGYMTNSSNLSNYNLLLGFYISSVDNSSYASKNGIKRGYIITNIDGNNIESVFSVTDVLRNKKVGDTISLKIMYLENRNYVEKEINISF